MIMVDDFVEDILKRDFYQELDTYQNDLLVIHGTKDTTVPYEISNKYMKLFHKGTKFVSIEDGNHNFDKLSDIKQVLKLTLETVSISNLLIASLFDSQVYII